MSLEVFDLEIALRRRVLLRVDTLLVRPGSVTGIMGPSGSGKSTFLRWICGLVAPAFAVRGRAVLFTRTITAEPIERRRVGILLQEDMLFGHMSIAENLSFGIPADASRAQRRRLVQDALVRAELEGLADAAPSDISQGQRARAAVMRVLLSQPRALLLDEPFANLDHELRARFRDFLVRHAREQRLPTLLVSHDRNDIEATSDNSFALRNQQLQKIT